MNEFHAALNGSASNAGSLSSPWDLQTALVHPSVKPGDTVSVHGGTYRGEFNAGVIGTASAPIIIRNYQGERATIDTRNGKGAALVNNGPYTWVWGLELMSGGSKRRTPLAASDELDRGMGFRNNAAGVKLINCIIHDTALGASHWGSWTSQPDFEAYGNLIYYNGWEQIPPGNEGRGHGHGFYTLSKANGPTKLRDNIVHTQFSQGIRMGDDGVFNPWIEGNICYQNGSHMYLFGGGRNIYVGGSNGQDSGQPYQPMTGAVVRNNCTYFAQNNAPYAEGLNLGLWWPNAQGEISGNYIAGEGGGDALVLGYWDTAKLTAPGSGNVIYGWVRPYSKQHVPTDRNTYYAPGVKPTQNVIIVRPNQYEPGRAHLAIYNWKLLSTVTVDLSGVKLAEGQAYEVRDAMNYYGASVAQGVFSSSAPTVAIPMTGLVRAPMTGEADVTEKYRPKPHTAPEFGAFIIVPGAVGVPLPPPPPPPAKVTAITAYDVDKASPQPAGGPITFTAIAEGGIAPIQYQWWVHDGKTWLAAQPWHANNTFVWTPSQAGTYYLQVWAKSAGAQTWEQYRERTFTITAPPVVTAIPTFTVDKPSPQPPNTSITLTAEADGGQPPYEYQWWVYTPTSNSWSVAQAWSTTNTFVWTPTQVGRYQIQAWARSAGSTTWEQFRARMFVIR